MTHFLTGKDLYDHKPLDRKVSIFKKIPFINNKNVILPTYEKIIQEVHLSQPDKIIIGHICKHEVLKWIVKIDKNRGKSFSTMGYSTKSFNFFLLEEALYLMESEMIQIFCDEIPITINQMYNIIAESYYKALDRYIIFESLIACGYILRLHNCDQLAEITKDYLIQPITKRLIDCSEIPKFSSELYSKVNIQNLNSLNLFKNSTSQSTPVICNIVYDLFSDYKSFSKSKPICPDYLVYHSVNVDQIMNKKNKCNEYIPVLAAIVDKGDVSFVQISPNRIADLKLIR